ncbi:MAG: sigma-70 family RNA polymerase sigma factor [Oscillospiraceae bacterium]|nr:sigma-70 family RNA polymerase sigma factor [Oscillospiraceae bacterium]
MFATAIAHLDNDDRAFMLNLYKNYYNLARKNIFSITHSREDVEDLINDVFIKLIEKIALLRTFDSCKTTTYIVYTIRSVSINYVKHKAIETKHLYFSEYMDILEDFPDSESGLDDRLIQQEESYLLERAISLLPQSQKDLLYFKYLLDMSDQEIAEVLGIAPNSVRQYLTRARRNAKKLIEKEMSYDAE